MLRSPLPRLPGSLLSFTLTVKDHFAIPAGVITVSVNTEYDDAVPAAALVKPSAFMAESDIEADRPECPQKIIFRRLPGPRADSSTRTRRPVRGGTRRRF